MTTDNGQTGSAGEAAEDTKATIPDVGRPLEGTGENEGTKEKPTRQEGGQDSGPGPGKETDDVEKAKPDPESIVNTTPSD
jgi:hypothetical protein